MLTPGNNAYPSSEPYEITAGPDGALWFIEYAGNKIGRVVVTTAVLSASPPSSSPGSTLTLTGSGFVPGESVKLYADATGVNLLVTANADSGGALVVTGKGHQALYGPHSLVGVGQTSARLGVAPLFITPRLIFDPATGAPGSAITVQGFGFGAIERVSVYWDSPRLLLGNATTDGKGSFAADAGLSFTIPAQARSGINGVFAQGQWTLALGKGYVNVQ